MNYKDGALICNMNIMRNMYQEARLYNRSCDLTHLIRCQPQAAEVALAAATGVAAAAAPHSRPTGPQLTCAGSPARLMPGILPADIMF